MKRRTRLIIRLIALLMAIGAGAWTFDIIRQARNADDGGPPMGALCMAVPAILLLMGAGAVWSLAGRR